MAVNGGDAVLIYNLFPRLAGSLRDWTIHFERAADMGFNWLYLNPFYEMGASGSLYAVADHRRVAPEFLDPSGPREPWDQVALMVGRAHAAGLRVMAELVVPHAASDSPLVQAHPAWFSRDGEGRPVHPGATDLMGRVQVWDDLVQFANAESPDREALWDYWRGVVSLLLDVGFDGLRAHMAHDAPGDLWRTLITHARAIRAETLFVAHTLGCPDWQSLEVARQRFDMCLNSARWWDFQQSWCLDQYRSTAELTRTISFPESHGSPRLMAELDGNTAGVRMRYLFAALFSSGVLMPIGFEYGFSRTLDPRHTRPEHWESPRSDLSDFIRAVNDLKASHRVFHDEGPLDRVEHPGAAIVALKKRSCDGGQRALIVLNSDARRAHPVFFPQPQRVLETREARDVTPGRESRPESGVVGSLPPAGFRVFVGDA